MTAPRHPSRRPRRAAPLLLVLTVLATLLGAPAAASLSVRASSGTAVVAGAAGAAVPSPSPRATDGPGASAGAGPSQGVDDDVVEVQVTQVSPRVVGPADELVVRATVRNGTDAELAAPQASLRVNGFLQSTRGSLDRWADQPLSGTVGDRLVSAPLTGPLAPGQTADVELRVPAGELRLSTADSAWGPRGLSVEVTDRGRREAVHRTFLVWQPTDQVVTPTRLSVVIPLTGGPVDPATPGPTPRAAEGSGSDAGTDDGGTGEGTDDEVIDEGTDDGGATEGTEDGGAAQDDAAEGPGTDPGTPTPSDDARSAPAPSATATVAAPSDDVLDRLDAVLSATADRPRVTWAVDPALVAAARATEPGSAAHRWVERLTAATGSREVLTLPAHDPDLAALAHASADALLAEAVAAAQAQTDPVLGATVRTDVAWPPGAVPDAATARLAAGAGATSMVVDGDLLAPAGLTYTPTGRATVPTGGVRPTADASAGTQAATAGIAALVTDPVLTAHLDAPTDTTTAAAVQRVLAETAVITRERPSEQRHLLVAVDRGWDPDPAVASAQLAALATAPWVELAPVATLAAAPDPGVERPSLPTQAVADAEITPGQVAALLRARDELREFAGIVPDPAALLDGVDDAVHIPLSVAWRAEPVQRTAVVDGIVTDLAARRSGVSVVPGSDLYLGSESGRFPLGLRNDLPQDVTVRVALTPRSPVLVIDEAQTVTIPAGSETQVRVPFHAVGSGDVRVAVALLGPDGAPIAAPELFTVRVRADWENVGTGVVAGLLALALVVGIVRTIRRGQTAQRGAGSTPVSEIARLPEESA